jgi:hypothetical protein
MNRKLKQQKEFFEIEVKSKAIKNEQTVDNFKNTITKLQDEIKKLKNKNIKKV